MEGVVAVEAQAHVNTKSHFCFLAGYFQRTESDLRREISIRIPYMSVMG